MADDFQSKLSKIAAGFNKRLNGESSQDESADTCEHCGQPKPKPEASVTPGAQTLAATAAGPAGQAFMANNPFKK